jgi:NDP-4-keto-2,6-dideoxyhexose 3-C-methyltransferase
MYCKNCKKKKLKKVIRIGKQPISSVFPEEQKFNLKEYSLDLYECVSCKLLQLPKLAPLNEMYGQTYGYRTSLSQLMIDHMFKKFLNIKKKFFLKKKSNILDIGSNDGTFLNFFPKNSFNLFGIDPSAEKYKKYYSKNINLIIDYFSKSKIDNFFKSKKLINKKFDLITAFAMFYDIENPNHFCKDINNLLNKDGLWITEFSYLPLLLKNLTYDQICHEHVTYYSLSSFQKIIDQNNMKVIDFSFNEINGGSIEVICAKKISKFKPNLKKINNTLDDEKKINSVSYSRFNKRIENVKNVLNLFLSNISSKKIIGYGASTKGNIILNHCNITSKNISYICDANPYKFNKFTPGSNIKIISKNKMRKIKPDYLLVLIWSFRTEVIKQELSYIKKGGKLIFHLPIFHVVDKNNYKSYLKDDLKTFSFSY